MESRKRWPAAARSAGFAALLGCGLTLAAGAARARVGGVAVQWGEVQAEVVGPMSPEARLQALSPGQTVRDAKFTRLTDRVEARLCGRFGVSAWLTAGPGERLPNEVLVVVHHPLTTRPDGASSTEDRFYTPVIRGEVGAFFSFENGWEMQPGDWTFEFSDGPAVLAAKSITITGPADPVAPHASCGGPPTS